jgi:DNA invertase Pin-like site-specific DNA recombinase
MKVAVYCRVSTEWQDADKQEALCLDFCKAHNFEVVKIFKDVISSTKDCRPAFNELREGWLHREFDCVVVTKLDRIGRSLKHLLNLFDEWAVRGIGFIAVTQSIDTSTAAGRLQLHILAAFAEFERTLISERTKEALHHVSGVGKRGRDMKPRKRRGSPKKVYEVTQLGK